MSDLSGPSGFFPTTGAARNKYPNPFYGVAMQYMPMDATSQMWWANHFLLRFGFYRTALARIANYFITELNIECTSAKDKKVYEDTLKALFWKEKLGEAGINLLAYGNSYASISPGFNRFLVCPKCGKTTSIESAEDYQFTTEGKYKYTCVKSKCGYSGVFETFDKFSKDPNKIIVKFWAPREVLVRWEDVTEKGEYFWEYPQSYVKKVTQIDKNNTNPFSKTVPQPIYDAIYAKKLFAFNDKNFLHLKLPTPAGVKTDGRGVPPCMYMFDDFFLLQVLRRYNEAICFEDINPFRIFSMSSGNNPAANSILNQDAGVWKSSIDDAISAHRTDPGSYQTVPFQVELQRLGGDGKQLSPIDMMEHSAANILNTLNVPQELFNMQLKLEAVGPALRLFENSWIAVPDNYNRMLQMWADVIANLKGLTPAKVSLIPTTLSDDMEKKAVMGQLMGANVIAKSTFLEQYDLNYKDQMLKKLEEDKDLQDLQQEMQAKQQAGLDTPPQQQGASPDDVIQQANEMAQKLFPMDGAQRRAELQKIKASGNQTLYAHVKQVLSEMGGQAKKQGLQSSKQQGGDPSQQQQPQQGAQ